MTIFIFLSTFAVYLFTLAPSITVGDSGEFCASSVILGLCHSPGYPLFSLVGKAATILFPLASFAYRVNLISALCGAATVTLLFKTMTLVPGDTPRDDAGGSPVRAPGTEYCAAIAAALLGFSAAFWKGSIQAEVFTLNTLFAAIIIHSVLKGRLNLALFAFGLGLGNHHTLVFLSPVLLWGLWKEKAYAPGKLLVLAVLFAAGMSIYAYLPVRAAKGPQLDWGNPVNVNNFIRVITRADYGSLSLTVGEKIPMTLSMELKQAARFARAIIEQFTPIGFVLGCVGAYLGLKKKYRGFGMIFAAWALSGPFFLMFANMPFNPETEGILERFYILVNLFWAFFMYAGLRWALASIKSAGFKAALFALVFVSVVALRAGAVGWRGYYLEYDYARNIFRTLAPGSAFFMDGGDDTFYGTAYLQFAEGMRKDVELHDRGGLVFRNVYGIDFRKLAKDEKEARRREVESSYLERRPVYFSTFNKDVMPGKKLYPDGVLYRAREPKIPNSYFSYSLRNVYGGELTDYRSRAVAPLYTYFEAYYDPARSAALRRFTLFNWQDAMWLTGNLKIELLSGAYDRYSSGDYAGASKVYAEILEYFPGDYETMLNLGVAYENMKDFDAALKVYGEAARAEPGKTGAYYNIAVIYWHKADWANAVKMFEKMLELDPGDERAKRFLPAARAKLSGKGA